MRILLGIYFLILVGCMAVRIDSSTPCEGNNTEFSIGELIEYESCKQNHNNEED